MAVDIGRREVIELGLRRGSGATGEAVLEN